MQTDLYPTSTDYAELVKRLDAGEVIVVVFTDGRYLRYLTARLTKTRVPIYTVGSPGFTWFEEPTAELFRQSCFRESLRWLVPPPPITTELPTEPGEYWCQEKPGHEWFVVVADTDYAGTWKIHGERAAWWRENCPAARFQKINPPEVQGE